MSSENDKEIAVTRPKQGFNNYFKVGVKMLLLKQTVVIIPPDMPNNEIISAICEKDLQLNQLVEQGEKLEVIKSWDLKYSAGEMQCKQIFYWLIAISLIRFESDWRLHFFRFEQVKRI